MSKNEQSVWCLVQRNKAADTDGFMQGDASDDEKDKGLGGDPDAAQPLRRYQSQAHRPDPPVRLFAVCKSLNNACPVLRSGCGPFRSGAA
jgi:hypothetical protein